MNRVQSRIEVPCNGCTLCCHGDLIRLERIDRGEDYKVETHPFIPGALMLAHKPNGDCIYLDSGKCSIHENAPSLCRLADCRGIAMKFDYDTARRLHAMRLIDIRVWDHGRMLIERGLLRRT